MVCEAVCVCVCAGACAFAVEGEKKGSVFPTAQTNRWKTDRTEKKTGGGPGRRREHVQWGRRIDQHAGQQPDGQVETYWWSQPSAAKWPCKSDGKWGGGGWRKTLLQWSLLSWFLSPVLSFFCLLPPHCCDIASALFLSLFFKPLTAPFLFLSCCLSSHLSGLEAGETVSV